MKLSRLVHRIQTSRTKLSLLVSRYRRYIFGLLAFGIVYGAVYAIEFTPLPVYVLDWLNLRPFFLPSIACTRCNNFSYPYMVENRNFCSPATRTEVGGADVYLLMLVATYHANADARQAIRKSWGSVREYRGRSVRTLFVFGRHDDPNYNYQVRYELERYGDVIQADFKDEYGWLTNKTMMGLRWVQEFCPGARYVLKTDDDGFNVPQRFIDYLIGIDDSGIERFVGGYCFTVMPDRREGSKFYVPLSMYPDRYYPTYCSGPGYVLSRLAVIDIVAVADNVLFLPMEDVFVSGVCRVAAKITYTQIVGVAEDQHQMTHCNLAVWVKNGHNIYPHATPAIWSRVVSADQNRDCAGRQTLTFCALVLFIGLWIRHISYIIQSGLNARTTNTELIINSRRV